MANNKNSIPSGLDMDSTSDPDKLTFDLLCRRFPLRPVRTREENSKAMMIADELLNRLSELSQAEKDYLEVIGDLIHKYESITFADEDIELEPHELIKSIIEAQGLKQQELAKELNIAPSRLSEFLSGKRRASRKLARILCERFSLSIESLFPNKDATNDDDSLEERSLINPDQRSSSDKKIEAELTALSCNFEKLKDKVESISYLCIAVQQLDAKISSLSSLLNTADNQ